MRRHVWIFGPSLAITFTLAVALAFATRREYAETLAAKVWPAGQFIIPNLNISNLEQKSILLFGDSRIADWNCPTIEGRHVVNAGFRGITSAQLAMGCNDVLKQTRPQMVVIQVGINDLKLLGIRPELREPVISNCVSNILTIVRESRQAGARVIVTFVWPAGKVSLMRRFVWSDAVDSAIAETNARLQKTLAAEKDATIADIFGQMIRRLSITERNQLYSDTLHLKPETYVRLSELLAEKVRPMMQHRTE
jgi:lysophospholipase L1-like esterase